MKQKQSIRKTEYDAVVVGSGVAGYQAADTLLQYGMKHIALFTEKRLSGTSRNTGSDKQTYYKLSLAGDEGDSVLKTAETLFSGGGMDGDIALALAAGSVECFIKLNLLGVHFPQNEYGEYVGYRTDHDPFCRASSVGPYTSKCMTEALERSALSRGLCLCENRSVIRILTDKNRVVGLLALCTDEDGIVLEAVKTPRILLATGGPAGLYFDRVYPVSQTGNSSLALSAGAAFSNLCEWQFGLASVDFPWNVSGSYQQVLPRYISVDENGIEREFLHEHYQNDTEMLKRIFKKGYEWPFDRRKIKGSSEIDSLVYRESVTLGRSVFLDFRRNPSGLERGLSAAGEEALNYLTESGALQSTPIERLFAMNPGAIELYAGHGIDLHRSPLRIAVCAQHCNGGIMTNADWESTVSGLYAAGEAAGSFGMFRPGGSALNDCMVGALRAARSMTEKSPTVSDGDFEKALAKETERLAALLDGIFDQNADEKALADTLDGYRRRMSRAFGFLRDIDTMKRVGAEIEREEERFFKTVRIRDEKQLPLYFKALDTVRMQRAAAKSMLYCAEMFGARGAAYVFDGTPDREKTPDGGEDQKIVYRCVDGNETVMSETVRPIPQRDLWFERVWKQCRDREKNGEENKSS